MSENPDDPDSARLTALAGDLRRLLWQLKRRLREQADIGDLTPSQVMAVVALEKCPATVTELAEAQGVRPQSMSATIAALEASGDVVGEPDPADGRKTIWSLTEEARARMVAMRIVRSDWLIRTIRRELNREEQDQLEAAVALLQRLVNS